MRRHVSEKAAWHELEFSNHGKFSNHGGFSNQEPSSKTEEPSSETEEPS
jgi:hypothetical protein